MKGLTFSDIQIFIARLILKKIRHVIHKRLTDRLSPAKTELFPFLKQLRDLREKIPYNSPSLYFSVVAFFAPTAEPSPYLRQLPGGRPVILCTAAYVLFLCDACR